MIETKETFLIQLKELILEHLQDNTRPVVIFSSVWPILKVMNANGPEAVESILSCILEACGNRTVLMPTFAGGFKDGVCNLDTTKSSTGVLTELFRVRPGVKRSLSAFFPYAVLGPESEEVASLIADEAWGKGSVYEWMEIKDVNFLLLGTDPTHCSYLHRFEWVLKDKIKFRFDKSFSGTLIRDQKAIEVTEILQVRRLDPPVVNTFIHLTPHLKDAQAKFSSLQGISITSYSAQNLYRAVLPLIEADPLSIVKNRKDYE